MYQYLTKKNLLINEIMHIRKPLQSLNLETDAVLLDFVYDCLIKVVFSFGELKNG